MTAGLAGSGIHVQLHFMVVLAPVTFALLCRSKPDERSGWGTLATYRCVLDAAGGGSKQQARGISN